ncbi:MAG: alpha/beta hydrolase [Armatimonadetes bacterium]|nr:alpha/beta hydrolase [Anaerolineae bacterium]
MPTLVTEQGIVHYETLGRGRPVLLLHGWLGSWALWRNTIDVLSKEFRVYALDFFGFGDSVDRNSNFSVNNFVESVDQFMDRLGIVKAPLVGHSMGGTVSLAAGVRFPEKIVKVIVIGSPVNGSSLNPMLKLAGYRGTARIAWINPSLLRTLIRGYGYFMAKDGRAIGNMIAEDMTKITVDSFFQSIGTLRDTDLRTSIGDLQMPVLGIYGKNDIIVDPKQHKVLKQYAPHSQIAWFEHSGHFPMMDEPQRFHSTVIDFLKNG